MAAKREPKDLLADAEKLKLEGNQAYADKSFKAGWVHSIIQLPLFNLAI